MDTHPTESVSVAFLAGLVRMSETNFRREFLRIFGTSPMKYRDALLISNARDALISGEYTVSEVAYVCGFSDPSYFARFFKKHTGMSPREFEKRGL
jgi:AraC-like DNA-binding protein